MVKKNSPNTWQMMTFLNPLDALIPKILFSFFADFWDGVTPEARRSVSVGFWEARQLNPFWGRGGSSQRALSSPPPSPPKRKPALLWVRCSSVDGTGRTKPPVLLPPPQGGVTAARRTIKAQSSWVSNHSHRLRLPMCHRGWACHVQGHQGTVRRHPAPRRAVPQQDPRASDLGVCWGLGQGREGRHFMGGVSGLLRGCQHWCVLAV